MCVAEALTQESMKKAAESVSAGMFPWERRQMDGGGKPLNTFERMYWIAFGGAIVFLVGVNGYRYWVAKQEVKVSILPWTNPFALYISRIWGFDC